MSKKHRLAEIFLGDRKLPLEHSAMEALSIYIGRLVAVILTFLLSLMVMGLMLAYLPLWVGLPAATAVLLLVSLMGLFLALAFDGQRLLRVGQYIYFAGMRKTPAEQSMEGARARRGARGEGRLGTPRGPTLTRESVRAPLADMFPVPAFEAPDPAAAPLVRRSAVAIIGALIVVVLIGAMPFFMTYQAARLKPTATAWLAAATLEAEETRQAQQAQAATAIAAAPVLAELPRYGVDPARGEVAWIHPPVTLEPEVCDLCDSDTEYFLFANQLLVAVVRNFVVSTEITSNRAFAVCGFALRSDGNERPLSADLLLIENEHVIFIPMVHGEVVEDDIQDIHARRIDPNFESGSGTTNRLTVVARGSEYTVFTNDTELGRVFDDRFEGGLVVMGAKNRGGTKCQFNNTWLFRMTE